MSRVEFETDEQGQEKRVYLKCGLKAPEPVMVLKRDLIKIPDLQFEPLPAEETHLTIFHYGKPTALHQELEMVGINIPKDDFKDRFGEMVRICWLASQEEEVTVIAKALDFNGDRFEKFGPEQSWVLALKLEKTDELRRYRNRVVRPFMGFLIGLGIRDVEAFMATSPNLQYQLDANYNPHLTLGKALFVPVISIRDMQLPLRPPAAKNIRFL